MRRPLLFIFLSTLLISGTSWGAWGVYRFWLRLQAEDPRFLIKAILVKSHSEDQVKPAMIAEWLNLSTDRPVNLYALNLKWAEAKILEKAHVKEVSVKRLPPATLLVEIRLREPIALLGEWTNRGIDADGHIFPLLPFYTPKKLPRLFLGDKTHFPLALKLLSAFKGESLYSLDLEKASHPSFGEREIVLNVGGSLLRLDPDRWQEGLSKWSRLPTKEIKIAELRIPNLAIISEGK